MIDEYQKYLLNPQSAYTIKGRVNPLDNLPADYDNYNDLNGQWDLFGGIAAHFKTSLGSNAFRNMRTRISGFDDEVDPNFNPLSEVTDPYIASRYWDEFYFLANKKQVQLKEEQIKDNLSARKKIDTLNFGTQLLAYPIGNLAGGDLSYFVPILRGGKILSTTKAFTDSALRVSGAEALYQIPKGWADPTAQESIVPGVSNEALFMIPTVGLFGGLMGAGLNGLRGGFAPRSNTPPPKPTPESPKKIESDITLGQQNNKTFAKDNVTDITPVNTNNVWTTEKAGTLKHEIVNNGVPVKLQDLALKGTKEEQSTALVVLENQYQRDIANAITFKPEDSLTKYQEYKDTEWVFEGTEAKEIHKVYTSGLGGRIVREIVSRPFGLGRSPYDFLKDMVSKYDSPNNPVRFESVEYNNALAELSYMMDDLVSDGALLLTTDKKAQGSGVNIQARREFDRLIPKINEAIYDGFALPNGYARGELRAGAYDLGVEREKAKDAFSKIMGDNKQVIEIGPFYDQVIKEIESPGSATRLNSDPKIIQGVEHTARVITEISEMFEKLLVERNLIGEPKLIQNEINFLNRKLENAKTKEERLVYKERLNDAESLLASVKEEGLPVRSGGYFPHLYREIPVARKQEFIDDLESQFRIDEITAGYIGKLTPRERAELTASRIMGEALEGNFINLSGRGRSKYFIERQITWHDKDKMLKWIDNDIFSVMANYIQRIGPLIKMNDFGGGDIMLSKQMLEIEKHFNIIKSTAPKKHLAKINEDMENFKLNIADMRDVVLGRMGNHGNPAGIQARTARLLKNYATMIFAGKFLYSSIPDIGNLAAIIGLKEIGIYTNALASGNKNLINAIEKNKEFTKEIGLAIETVLGSNARFMEPNQYRTPSGGMGQFGLKNIEDIAEKGANAMHIANLLLPWTTMTKQLAGTLTTSQLIRNSIELTANVPTRNGKKYVADIPKKDIKEWQRLQNLGLSKSDIIRIGEQRTGVNWEVVKEGDASIYVGNVNNWTDKKLAEKFEIAVFEQTELAIMIPGISSKPNYLFNTMNVPFRGKWAVKVRKEMNDIDDAIRDGKKRGMSEEELAPQYERFRELQAEYSGLGRKYVPLFSLIFQFRSFGIGAAQKITQAFTQGRQRSRWSGLSAVIGLAYLSNYLRNPYYRFLDEEEQMLTALEYSGVTNWLLDFNTSIETLAPLLTDDEFGLRQMLGMDPKWSYDDNIDRIGGGFGTGYAALYKAYDLLLSDNDKTERETASAVRQLVPFNNLFYLSPIAKQIQNQVLEADKLDRRYLYGD